MELSALSLRLRALSVLRGLLSHPLVRAYADRARRHSRRLCRPLRRTVRDPLLLRRYRAGSARRRAL